MATAGSLPRMVTDMGGRDMVRGLFAVLSALWLTEALGAAAPADLNGKWIAVGTTTEIRTSAGRAPPLRPAAAQAKAQTLAALGRGDRSSDSATHCIPPGVPRLYGWRTPFLIAQRPYLVLMLFQSERLVRQIYLQDRYPAGIDASHLGNSTGHWNGSELVIETSDFKSGGWLDDAGTPFSASLHLTERLTRRGSKLIDKIEIDDPQNYSGRWQATVEFKALPGNAIAEDVCVDRMGLLPKELRP